jgi:hypothetical protein
VAGAVSSDAGDAKSAENASELQLTSYATEADDERWFVISTGLVPQTLDGQIRVLESLSSPGALAFNSAFAVGVAASANDADLLCSDLLSLEGISDVVFSVVVETMVRFSPERLRISENSLNRCRNHLQAFTLAAAAGDTGPIAPFTQEFGSRLQPVVRVPDRTGVADFRASLVAAKREFVPLVGPDVFSISQALCDPTMSIRSERMDNIAQFMGEWKLTRSLTCLLLLRLAGPYENEREFLRDRFTTMVKPFFASTQQRMIASLLGLTDRLAPSHKPRSSDYSCKLIWLYHRLDSALRANDPRRVMDAVVDIYCLDTTLIGFLNWDRIYKATRDFAYVDAKTAFITFLMNEDIVRNRFPDVAMATGKGALISDLMSLIDQRKITGSIPALMSRFKELPLAAASALALSALERSNVERLAGSLPRTRHWPRGVLSIDGAHASMARMEALGAAADKGLITRKFAEDAKQQEIDHLRMQSLQGRLRTGRVQIPWEEVEKATQKFADSELPIVRLMNTLASDAEMQDALPKLSDFIAEKITEHLLYGSDVGIDRALSNNLRHGVVVPRFLRAFDDALQTVGRGRSIPAWDEATLEERFGAHSGDLLALRDLVNDQVKDFVEARLTVEADGRFNASLQSAISLALLRSARSQGTRKRLSLQKQVVSAARRQLNHYLADAARELNTTVRDNVIAELRSARSTLRSRPHAAAGTFLDSLETNLHEAFDEVRQWIGVTKTHGDAPPFQLREVVKLHLLSTALFAWDKLKVETRFFRSTADAVITRDDSCQINGKYLEFVQIVVHNVLSNAFKYSGQKLKTVVRIEMFASEDKLLIRCINSISDSRIDEIIRDHAATLAYARGTDADQARRDIKSGFPKIRQVYKSALNSPARFNIPPITSEVRWFVIEISSACPRDFFAS